MEVLQVLFKLEMVRAILAGIKTQTRRIISQHNSHGGSGRKLSELDLSRAWVDGKGTNCEYLHAPVIEGNFGGCWERIWPNIAPLQCWDQKSDGGYKPPASRMWVREGFCETDWKPGTSLFPADPRTGFVVAYRADYDPGAPFPAPWKPEWKPSIHMPRWASRITLEITDVRVQRLQEISDDDIAAEGIEVTKHAPGDFGIENPCATGMVDLPGGVRRHSTAQCCFASLWDTINRKRAPWASNPWVWAITFRRI